jgi:hypothetical protein
VLITSSPALDPRPTKAARSTLTHRKRALDPLRGGRPLRVRKCWPRYLAPIGRDRLGRAGVLEKCAVQDSQITINRRMPYYDWSTHALTSRHPCMNCGQPLVWSNTAFICRSCGMVEFGSTTAEPPPQEKKE